MVGLAFLAGCSSGFVPVPASEDFTLRNVTVVEPLLTRVESVDLQVRDGRVVSISPTTSPWTEPRYVLPGFVDAHVHSFPTDLDDELFALLQLMHGVTTVRNAAHPIHGYREDVEAGRRIGPHVLVCGVPIEAHPSTFAASVLGRTATKLAGLDPESEDDFREAVRLRAENGANCIKVFINVTEPQLRAVNDEAHRRDLTVMGHVPLHVDLANAPIDDIQHLTGVPAAPSAAFTDDEPFLEWLRGWSRLDDWRRSEVIDAARRFGTYHTPTLVIWAGRVRFADPEALSGFPDEALVPAVWAETFWVPSVGFGPSRSQDPDTLHREVARAWPHMLSFIGDLNEAGVPMLVGTDPGNPYVVPGASYHHELALLVEAGLRPEEALAAATWRAGERMRRPELGRVRVGVPADLVVFERDPSADLGNLDSLERTIVAGRVYEREDLARHHSELLDRAESTSHRARWALSRWMLGLL